MSVILDRSGPVGSDPSPKSGVSLSVVGLLVGLALILGASAGFLLAPQDASPTPGDPSLDAEWDYLGAMDTWPAEQSGTDPDPFDDDFSDAELVAAGRVVCTRAADPDMSFDGMLDLLRMSPHQTYVVMAESADKLCPSQEPAITQHLG